MIKVARVTAVSAFLMFYMMTSPDQASNIAEGSWHLVTSVAHGVGNFIDKLAS